jgi:hypothetical protein
MNTIENPDLFPGITGYALGTLERASEIGPGGTGILAARGVLKRAVQDYQGLIASNEETELRSWLADLGRAAQKVIDAAEGLLKVISDERGEATAAFVRGPGEVKAA